MMNSQRLLRVGIVYLGFGLICGLAGGCSKPEDTQVSTSTPVAQNNTPVPEPVTYESMVAQLGESDPRKRVKAVDQLLNYPDRLDDSISLLIERTNDSDVTVRVISLEKLGRLMERAESAVPAIQARFNDEVEAVRLTAATSFVLIVPDRSEEALPVFVQGLDSKDPVLQVLALRALSQFGSMASSIIPKIQELESSTSPQVRGAAKQTLQILREES